MDDSNKTIRTVVITLCVTVLLLCTLCSCTVLGSTFIERHQQ